MNKNSSSHNIVYILSAVANELYWCNTNSIKNTQFKVVVFFHCPDLYSILRIVLCRQCCPLPQKRVLHLITATDENVRQYMARLINAFASLAGGQLRKLLSDELETGLPKYGDAR